jgi:hypothetical protein
MRVTRSTLAFAGSMLIASSFGAVAAPVNGTAIRDAAAEIGLTENVHCRPFRHWHRWGYGRGCARGAVIYNEGVRVRSRFGYRTRDDIGVRFRSRDRDGVSIRSGTTFREGTTIRGGSTERSGTTIRGGASGSVESRGTISGGQAREGTTGGIRGGGGEGRTMRTAPTGQGGGGVQGGAGGSIGGGAGPGGGAGTR